MKDDYKVYFKGAKPIDAFIRWLRGQREPARFSDRPEWLKKELLDKAVAKREMRAQKRLNEREEYD